MPSDIAIRVEGLSKKYRLQHKTKGEGLRHAFQGAISAPWRKIRSAIQSGANGISDSGRIGFPNSDQKAEEFWALKDVSFDIKRGEVVGIIGRNGAGKSTLLKILSRITEPTTGRIEIDGRVASLLEVGTGFHPELTGRENIFLNGAILGMTRAEVRSKFDEIVAFAEVERFLDTPVKRYSSGMYVRLAFSVAAHLEPEILVVDEVLAVGDAQFQRKCLGKMQDIALAGSRTVLFVSHNMEAVLRLCTQGVLLQAGAAVGPFSTSHAVHLYHRSIDELADVSMREKPRAVSSTPKNLIADLHIKGAPGAGGKIVCGGPVQFELVLENLVGLRDVVCAIIILNTHGQRVAMLHSLYHSGVVLAEVEGAVLVCKVPCLSLVPGDYRIDLAVGLEDRVVIERIENAAKLTVTFADMFGTGRLPNEGQGYAVLPASWERHPMHLPAAFV